MISGSLCTYYSWCCCCHWRDYWRSSWVVDVPKMLTCPRTSGCSATNCFSPATMEKCQIFSSLITITKTKFHGQKSDDAQIFVAPGYIQGLKIIDQSVLATLQRPWEQRWPERIMNEHCRPLPAWSAKSESEWKMFLIGLSVMHIELWAGISSDAAEAWLPGREMKVSRCYFLWTDSLHDGMDLTILGITRAGAWKPSRIVKRSCQ